MSRARWIIVFAFVALALGLRLGTVLAAPREQVITILHTNDMHGRVLSSHETDAEGPGGLARVSSMVRRIRAANPNVILMDAGDIYHGTPTELVWQGDPMIRAMNAAGFDVATLGNHEFDWSKDVTARRVAGARFPFLSANVRDVATGKVFGGAREYVVLERGGVKVAVFGLTTLQTVAIEWPAFLRGVRFEDPVETARRVVPELRRKADLVVFLSHLGYQQDRLMAEAVPGIDVIIGGHSHTTLPEVVRVGDTVITQTGALAKNLGRMDIRFRRTSQGWKMESINGADGRWWEGARYPRRSLLEVVESEPRDARVTSAYEPAWRDVAKMLAEPAGTAPSAIPGQDARKGPRPLQPLIADLLRESVRADVALVDAGIGPEIPTGPLTAGTIFGLVGGYTRQNVVMVRATGAAIRQAVAKSYAAADRYPVYYAGLGGNVVRDGDNVEWRVATVGGLPLEDTATYTVAAPSYLIMDHPSLMASPLVSDRLGWQKPLLAKAARARGVLIAGEPKLRLPPPPPPKPEDNGGR